MNDEPDEDADEKIETYRQFAATRSNQDSKLSNENLKAAAQAAILINGGAASALLAFLSKETIGPLILKGASLALVIYAIGVAMGAWIIFSLNRALMHWNEAWVEILKDPTIEINTTKQHAMAQPWLDKAMRYFRASIFAFVMGSGVLAIAFSTSTIWTPTTVQKK